MFALRPARFARPDIAIDLGTANTLVVERGSGVIFDEASVCCYGGPDRASEVVAIGTQAQDLAGRVTKPLRIVRPLANGVLSDISAASELLRFATRGRKRTWRLTGPRALIGVPADATQAERSALITAATDAGISQPQLVDEPLLSAIGVGVDVDEPRGRMIVDCGAGTTEVAVISLGRICLSQSVRGGGEALDRALIDHFHLRHRFLIGALTAERIKLELSGLIEEGVDDRLLEVRGLDTMAGMPKTLAVRADELFNIWHKSLDSVVAAVKAALGDTAPELSHDILEDGIILAGGAAMTGLLAQRITEGTGIEVRVADAPLRSVAAGLRTLLEAR